jgi:hypothetical protein
MTDRTDRCDVCHRNLDPDGNDATFSVIVPEGLSEEVIETALDRAERQRRRTRPMTRRSARPTPRSLWASSLTLSSVSRSTTTTSSSWGACCSTSAPTCWRRTRHAPKRQGTSAPRTGHQGGANERRPRPDQFVAAGTVRYETCVVERSLGGPARSPLEFARAGAIGGRRVPMAAPLRPVSSGGRLLRGCRPTQ